MSVSKLTHLDFQLAYLVLLTRYGLKPLSRWEKRLSEGKRDIICSAGLELETVERRTRIGRKLVETVFAGNSRRPRLYRSRFDGTRLRQTPEVVRLEGSLFGYPSCCVESFIRHPYGPNGLCTEDQEILFHWACSGCVATPILLREYQRVYRECLRRFGASAAPCCKPGAGVARTAVKVAASIALVAGMTGSASATNDPHWLPAHDDMDGDYLSFAEEIISGADWENSDTDQNLVLDGVQMSHRLRQLIASPPPGVEVVEHPAYGLEICDICAEVVNMGFVTVTNIQRGLSIDLPYITLHFLEHGCLQYVGDIHSGRVDLDLLKQILFPSDPAHLLPLPGDDPDSDGLLSEEEPLLDMNPDDPDTDDDSLIDGPQVAEDLLSLIGELPREELPDRPYMLEMWADGLEQCEVCGITFNMGHALIVNPLEDLTVTVPFVSLHSLAHGSFAFDGTTNEGRILPTVLRTVLTGEGTAHWVPIVSDTDGDGLKDEEEPFFNMDPADPDEDENGIPDGRELATQMAAEIHALPEGPLPDSTYAINHYALGFYNCLICGEEINMGYLEVVDPVNGCSVEVPYYNLHFMDHGSFSTDRDDIYPRVDLRLIGQVLGIQSTDVPSESDAPGFAFWSAPNPFRPAGSTQIVLSLPSAAGEINVAIYNSAGRSVRDLYSGTAPGGQMRFQWDGRDNAGKTSGAGVYFCKVNFKTTTVSRKIVLMP